MGNPSRTTVHKRVVDEAKDNLVRVLHFYSPRRLLRRRRRNLRLQQNRMSLSFTRFASTTAQPRSEAHISQLR